MSLSRNDDHVPTQKECMFEVVSKWIGRVCDDVLDECKHSQNNALIQAYNEGRRDAFLFVTDLLRMVENK